MKYVIEHMDKELWEWSQIEYKNISKSVGKDNLIITNVKKTDLEKLKNICSAKTESVMKLGYEKACILDPNSDETLVPSDAKKFNYLIFGGILGNDPPEARTKDLVIETAERRNLGKDQFSTDNAVMVAKKIIDGTPLSKLKFIDGFTLEIDDGEEIILPYKYLIVDGKPYISDEIVEYIKKHGF